MEGSSHIEREYGALGGLFQQIIQDMKVGDMGINAKGQRRSSVGKLCNCAPFEWEKEGGSRYVV